MTGKGASGRGRGLAALVVLLSAAWGSALDRNEGEPHETAGPAGASLLRVREVHADHLAGTLLLRGEGLGTSPDTMPTVTLSGVPLTVVSATDTEALAQLPAGLAAGTYRVRVARTPPGGTAGVWTDAMDVTTARGVDVGDITAANTPAGGGLQGGVASGEANLGLVACGAGQVLKWDESAWSCVADADAGINAVVNGGGIAGSIADRALTLGSTATPASTAGAIVGRGGTGSFQAGSASLSKALDLPSTASASMGVLTKGSSRFLHNYGANNTFVGAGAGNFSLTGTDNSAFGYEALRADTTGYQNSALGSFALASNTTARDGVSAFGSRALHAIPGGTLSSAFGHRALESSTNYGGSAFGYLALAKVAGGPAHAFGCEALTNLVSGSSHIAIGHRAGYNLTSGTFTIYIGTGGASSESKTIRIGNDGDGGGFHPYTATHIAAIYGKATNSVGAPVYVNVQGRLGTTTSARRYKQEIADMAAESDVLMRLRPVSFYYRPELDTTHTRQHGLVAEEVAEVAPGLVAYDENGAPLAVRYHFVDAMLLNEVQKQRRRLEAQKARLRELRERQAAIDELRARIARLEERVPQ